MTGGGPGRSRAGAGAPDRRLRFAVRVRPGASRAKVGGSHDGALVVAVQVPAVDGRATAAAVAAVAAALAVPGREVSVVSGFTSRTKVFQVEVSPDREAAVRAALAGLLGADH